MRFKFLAASYLTATALCLPSTGIARDRWCAQPCAPTQQALPAIPEMQVRLEVEEIRRRPLPLDGEIVLSSPGGQKVHLCVICPPGVELIIEGRQTYSTGKVREYEVMMAPSTRDETEIQLIAMQGDKVLYEEPVTVKQGRPKTVVITDGLEEAREKLKVERNLLELERLKIAKETLEMQAKELEAIVTKLKKQEEALRNPQPPRPN